MITGWVRLVASSCRPSAPRLAVSVAAGVAASGASIGLMATSAWLISRAATHPPVLHLMVAIVAVRAFGLSRGVFRYAERLLGHDAALRVLADLRVRTYQALARLAPAGLRSQRHGDLLASFVSDVDAILDVLVRVVLPYAAALAVAACSIALVSTMSPITALAMALGLCTVAFVVPMSQSAATRRADARVAPLRGELASQTVDLFCGMADLTACGAVDDRLRSLAAVDERLRSSSARSSGTTGIGAAIATLAGGCCVLAGLASGTIAVRSGLLDGELLAVVVLTPMAVFEALSGLPAAAQRFGAARASLQRIAALLAMEDPTPEPAVCTPLPQGSHVIALRDVHASWVPGRPALSGVSLSIRPGTRVALVGESGSGKSTVAALLTRFLDPVAGSVTIDGIDLRDLASDEVRRLIRLCDDEAYLFDSTIEANLRIGLPDATEEQLRAALEAARLLSLVDGLPLGMSTMVGEHGVRLSGGQRRRLALARALLGDPALLVLDEPTEHLDEATATAILLDLLGATTGRTVLLITHRASGLDAFDAVVTLANGRVVEHVDV